MTADGLGPKQMARIEELVQEIEALPDAKTRETAAELVQLLMEFYGQGLARMLAIAGNAADSNCGCLRARPARCTAADASRPASGRLAHTD